MIIYKYLGNLGLRKLIKLIKDFVSNSISAIPIVGDRTDGLMTPSMYQSLLSLIGWKNRDESKIATLEQTVQNLQGISYLHVIQLPETGDSKYIYLVEDPITNTYYEYIWLEDSETFEKIGDTDIALRNYVTKTDYQADQTNIQTAITNANDAASSATSQASAANTAASAANTAANAASRAAETADTLMGQFSSAEATRVLNETARVTNDENRTGKGSWSPTYNSGNGYAKGNIVYHDNTDAAYMSLISNNTQEPDGTTNTYWQILVDSHDFERKDIIIKSSLDTHATLSSNKMYEFPEMTSLTIAFETPINGEVNEYQFRFISGSTATTLTVPAAVVWTATPSIEINKLYEANISYDITRQTYYGIIVGWEYTPPTIEEGGEHEGDIENSVEP